MTPKRESDERQIENKALDGGIEIKDAEKGEVEAIVATLNVVDRDYEVIREGAIKSGSKVKLSAYGHDAMWGNKPVGKGALHVEDNKVVFKGRFFMTTDGGLDAFRTIKEMGAEQEWSFGFRVLGSEVPDDEWKGKGARRILTKLDAFEVSPVIIGAGVGTRTVSAKEADEAAAAAADAEAKAKADADKEAERMANEARDAHAKKEAAAVEQKALVADALSEYDRVQRTLKRLGVA